MPLIESLKMNPNTAAHKLKGRKDLSLILKCKMMKIMKAPALNKIIVCNKWL